MMEFCKTKFVLSNDVTVTPVSNIVPKEINETLLLEHPPNILPFLQPPIFASDIGGHKILKSFCGNR